jgi:hypothetical protein
LVCPHITEPVWVTFGIDQRFCCQCLNIERHTGELSTVASSIATRLGE